MSRSALLVMVLLVACNDGESGHETSAEHVIALVFAGDTMLAGDIPGALAIHDLSYADLLTPIADRVDGADIAFFNLESVVGASGEPLEKEFTFNAAPEALAALGDVGFDMASLANNHSLDYGDEGLSRTRQQLLAKGMAELGLAKDEEPQQAVVRQFADVSVGFLAYADPLSPYAYPTEFENFSPRPAAVETTAVARDLAALGERVDLTVVSVHWGQEQAPITERQRELGRYLVRQGADVVVGHHPHIQQPSEWYERGLIIYSLGNFLFGLHRDPRHLESRLVRVVANRAGVLSASELHLSVEPESFVLTPRASDFSVIAR